MPITLDEDLHEGLRISQSANGLMLTRKFHAKDLTGSNPTDILATALTLTTTGTAHSGANLPEMYESVVAGGLTFYCKNRDAEPWPPADALITCTYDTDPPPVAGFGPITIEGGASLEQAETDFDFDNLQLPFASRVPITVDPPLALIGDSSNIQSVRVPIWVPKHCLILTRQESSDPSARADGWIGYRNSDVFRGYAVNTCLMFDVRYRRGGDGIWDVSYVIARDPLGKWDQVARWRNPLDGSFPNLTVGEVAASHGVQLVTVQGSKAFAPLNLG